MAKTNKIKVINNTTGSFVFYGIDEKRYLFTNPNSYKLLDMNIIEGLYNDYPRTFTEGYLIFEDKSVYEELGIEKEIYEKLLPLDKIEEILDGSVDELASKLEEVPNPIKENIATTAKKKGIDSKRKTNVIKDKTGFNIDADVEE